MTTRLFVILLAVATLTCSSTPVSANGAMGLALATFPWTVWLVNVIVTVLFEAAWLGRALKVPFHIAIRTSLAANFASAIIGGFLSGIVSYSFYGVFGTRMNPNPFGQTLLVFILFGLGSALVETFFWTGPATKSAGVYRPLRVLRQSVAAHLLVIPIGLAILLLPERPYVGLESQAAGERHGYLRSPFKKAVEDYIAERRAFPPVRTYEQLLTLWKPQLGSRGGDRDLWAAAYVPEFHRFDTGEMRKGPHVEWNPQASGKKILESSTGIMWLTRVRASEWCSGLVIVLPYTIRWSNSQKELGFLDESQSERPRPR